MGWAGYFLVGENTPSRFTVSVESLVASARNDTPDSWFGISVTSQTSLNGGRILFPDGYNRGVIVGFKISSLKLYAFYIFIFCINL